MYKSIEVPVNIPEIEIPVFTEFEKSKDPVIRLIIAQRLGALASAAETPEEAEPFNTRAFAHYEWIHQRASRGSSLPTLAGLTARANYNLYPLITDMFVYKKISSLELIQQRYQYFLNGIKFQARHAREFMAESAPRSHKQRILHSQLVVGFNNMGILSFLLRDLAHREKPPNKMYLPSVIDSPLVRRDDGKVHISSWHIGRYTVVNNQPAHFDRRIYVRTDKDSKHDLDVDPDTSVVWAAQDINFGIPVPPPDKYVLPIDMLLELLDEKEPDPEHDRRVQSIYRAIATRDLGTLVSTKALPQLTASTNKYV